MPQQNIVHQTIVQLLIQSPFRATLLDNILQLDALYATTVDVRRDLVNIIENIQCANNVKADLISREKAIAQLEFQRQPMNEISLGDGLKNRLRLLTNTKFAHIKPAFTLLLIELMLNSLNQKRPIGAQMPLSKEQTLCFFQNSGIPIKITSITTFHCLCIAASSATTIHNFLESKTLKIRSRYLELNCMVETYLEKPIKKLKHIANTPQGSILYMATWFGSLDAELLTMYLGLKIKSRWLRPTILACQTQKGDFIQTYQALCPMFIEAQIPSKVISALLEYTLLENRLLQGIRYDNLAYAQMRERLYTASSLACLLGDFALLGQYQQEANTHYPDCIDKNKKHYIYLNYLTPLKLACLEKREDLAELLIANLLYGMNEFDMQEVILSDQFLTLEYQSLLALLCKTNTAPELSMGLLQQTTLESRLFSTVQEDNNDSIRLSASSLACLLNEQELLIGYQIEANEHYLHCASSRKEDYINFNYLKPLRLACESANPVFIKFILTNIHYGITELGMRSHSFIDTLEYCSELLERNYILTNELELFDALRETLQQQVTNLGFLDRVRNYATSILPIGVR